MHMMCMWHMLGPRAQPASRRRRVKRAEAGEGLRVAVCMPYCLYGYGVWRVWQRRARRTRGTRGASTLGGGARRPCARARVRQERVEREKMSTYMPVVLCFFVIVPRSSKYAQFFALLVLQKRQKTTLATTNRQWQCTVQL